MKSGSAQESSFSSKSGKRGAAVAALLLCLLFLPCAVSCAPAPNFLSSYCEFSHLDGDRDAEKNARALLDRFEAEISTQYADSDISKLNRAEGGQPVQVGETCARLLLFCKSQYESDRTDGLFSPSLYALSELWGFAEKSYRVPSDSEISETLAYCDFSEVEISGNVVTKKYTETKFDLGGMAKGFALQMIRDSLRADGATRALVNLAGSFLIEGKKEDGSEYRIGIEDPRATETGYAAAAILELSDCYVSTSSDAENFFISEGKRYCHILDPRTGAPAESDLLSVTVVWQTGGEESGGALSDLWSTAFFLMGRERAMNYAVEHNISVFLLGKDGKYFTNLPLAEPTEDVNPEYSPL